MPTFNAPFKNNTVIFYLGMLLVGFLVGAGVYQGVVEMIGRDPMDAERLENLQKDLVAKQERIAALEDALKAQRVDSEQNVARLQAQYEAQRKQAQETLPEPPQDHAARGEPNAAQLQAHYEAQLKQAQEVVADSNATIPRLEAELESLRESSNTTRQELTAMRSERDRLAGLVGAQRPILTFSVAALPSLKEIVFQGRNETSIPLKVVNITGVSWVNKNEQLLPYGQTRLMVPGKEAPLVTFHLDDQLASSALIGKTDLRYAVCVIYESERGSDSQRWMANWWFYYEPKFNSLSSLIQGAHEPVLTSSSTCDIKLQQPDGWLQ